MVISRRLSVRRAVRRRRARRTIVWLLLAVLALGAIFHEPLQAQWRAFVVLGEVLDRPALQTATRPFTEPATSRDISLAGSPTTVYTPAGEGPWPAVMLLTGVDESGRRHPDVVRASRALARAGFVVYTPDTPGLREQLVSVAAVDATARLVEEASRRSGTRDAQVALVSVSAGASLALLVAAEANVRDRISVVLAIAPYADIRTIAMLATTGHYRARDGRLLRYESDPQLRTVFERSTMRAAAGSRAGEAFIRALLANRDPERFAQLYDALPPEVRSDLERLSPLHAAGRITARVELASAPVDKYFPLDQSQRLDSAIADSQLTVTPLLDHAIPQDDRSTPGELVRFDLLAVRVLDHAG